MANNVFEARVEARNLARRTENSLRDVVGLSDSWVSRLVVDKSNMNEVCCLIDDLRELERVADCLSDSVKRVLDYAKTALVEGSK